MRQDSYDGSATLFLISTPIGNLDDITYRSIRVLKEVDVIFSEDTRVTLNLLNSLNIKKKLISLHEHNEESVKEKVLNYLKNNNSVALVTDRGTPIISDPGFKTVKYVIENNYNVVALPGATALIPALITSGISPQPFLFYGFLNSKENKKREELVKLSSRKETMIFYEAPHRIKNTLSLMYEIFGNRIISVSRELTKKFETIYRGDIKSIVDLIDEIGEFVIVVEGNKKTDEISDVPIKDAVEFYINSGLDTMSAIKKVAKERNLVKNDVYMEYHRESE